VAEPSGELMMEILRAIRGDLGRIERKLDETRAEVRIMRRHVAGIVGDDALTAVRLDGHESRIERIERRLELRDAD
jgi:hypothetical protein